ncbi:MAG: hypothetical protein ABWU16_04150 [Halothiobacillaceae bacterium]
MKHDTLNILAWAELGPYLHLTLEWPNDRPAPAPGQHLRLAGGHTLWPMRDGHRGRLEILTDRSTPFHRDEAVSLEGTPLVYPQHGEALFIAQGLGLAPLIHLCERLHGAHPKRLLALYELPTPPPFRPRPSRFLIAGMPAGVIAAIPLLEDWGIPSRLASVDGLPGAFEGGADALFAALPLSPGTTIYALGDAHFLARVKARSTRLDPALHVG